jgi:hypothetical protein
VSEDSQGRRIEATAAASEALRRRQAGLSTALPVTTSLAPIPASD